MFWFTSRLALSKELNRNLTKQIGITFNLLLNPEVRFFYIYNYMTGSFCVFLNDNILSHVTQRGISRYFRKITDGIIAHFGNNVIIYSPEIRDYGIARHIHCLPNTVCFPGSRWLGINSVLPKLRDMFASTVIAGSQASIIYSPYYGSLRSNVPQVFTVYDMIYELFPQYYPRNYYSNQQFLAEKKYCLERSLVLFAISENTARDIELCYPHIDPGKIVVTYLGVDEIFFRKSNQQVVNVNKPFFLYVGNRVSHKNFLRLLIAFGQSGLAKEFDLRVVSPVGSRFDKQERVLIDAYQLQDSVFLMSAISEIELRDYYAGAVALVYPSEYEGFGLPILEAMASGTLVATSNTSSMPEIGGTVAFYFDPYNTDTIVDCLLNIVNLSVGERVKRIMQGVTHARKFTWKECCQKTVSVLKQLI